MAAPLSMNPARRVVLALGLPVVLALIAAVSYTAVALADQAGYRVHVSVLASHGQSRVTIDNADATVRPGSGDKISLSANLLGSLAPPSFSSRSGASGLILHSQCWAWSGFCSLKYDITAPAGLPLTVFDGSGDLNASGFRGHVALSDGSGDVAASDLTGTISLATGSGDINASALNGDGVQLSDGSGDIFVSGLAATDITGNDGSGDLTLTFTKAPRQVDVTVGSGDITLVLPQGPVSYHVEASSQSGSTSVTVKQARSSPYVIIASSGSGDVTVAY
jgi:Putative adhesin